MGQERDKSGAPYCLRCGYDLRGATHSAKCPECGRSLVDVLTRHRHPATGANWRYRSSRRLLGVPLVDIALGENADGSPGQASGFIAIGDSAQGVVAIGSRAVGIVAVGPLACGVFSLGAVAFGLLTSVGGVAFGGFVGGGLAMGAFARGGMAIGAMADGGAAIGYVARGGATIGKHMMNASGVRDAEAIHLFDAYGWFFGGWPPTMGSFLTILFLLTGAPVVVGALLALLAWLHTLLTPSKS